MRFFYEARMYFWNLCYLEMLNSFLIVSEIFIAETLMGSKNFIRNLTCSLSLTRFTFSKNIIMVIHQLHVCHTSEAPVWLIVFFFSNFQLWTTSISCLMFLWILRMAGAFVSYEHIFSFFFMYDWLIDFSLST